MGDVFVRLAGTGTWQIALVIGAIMSLAVLVDPRLMLVTQAGVQAATTLVPCTAAGHWDVAPARQLSFRRQQLLVIAVLRGHLWLRTVSHI
jgi:hypothetical protein